MTAQKNRTTRAERHTGDSFSRSPGAARKTASLGLAACMVGGALLAAPAAHAAPADADPGWRPVPSVLGSTAQPGPFGDGDISEKGVWPGQKLEYKVTVDLKAPEGADPVETLEVVNKLPKGITAVATSVRVISGTTNIQPAEKYTVDAKDGSLKVEFTDEWVAANIGPDAEKPLTDLAITFSAEVTKDAEKYSAQTVTVDQIVNGQAYDNLITPLATVITPGVETSETVSASGGDIVGDRVVVGGDQLEYAVKLDGTFGEDVKGKDGVVTPTPLELAYDVSAFGIVDTYDRNQLDIKPENVEVLLAGDPSAANEAGRFDITVKDGVLSVLAKKVTEKGRTFVPLDLLGKDYTVKYLAGVKDSAKDATISGTTVQVVNDTKVAVSAESKVKYQTVAPSIQAVQRAEAPVQPLADEEGTGGAEETAGQAETVLETVPQDGAFSYKVGSSKLPANRMTPTAVWTLEDSYTYGDQIQQTGWTVVADTDIKAADGTVLVKAGDVLAEAGNTAYFTLDFSGNTAVATARQDFLDLVNADLASEISWSVYVDAIRISKEGNAVSNTANEISTTAVRGATVKTATGAAAAVEPVVPPVTPAPTPEPTNPTTPPADPSPSPSPTPEPTTPADPDPSAEPTPPGNGGGDDKGAPADEKLISIESYVLNADGTRGGDHDSPDDAFVVASDPAASVSSDDPEAPAHAPVKVQFVYTNLGDTELVNAWVTHKMEGNSSGGVGTLACETGDDTPPGTLLTTLSPGQTITCVGEVTGIEAGGQYAATTTVTADIAGAPAVENGAPAKATAEDGLFITLAGGEAAPAGDGEAAAADDKRGAVTGEGVSSNSPLLMTAGGIVLALALGAALFLGTRMIRGSSASAKE